jgi:predicted ATPase
VRESAQSLAKKISEIAGGSKDSEAATTPTLKKLHADIATLYGDVQKADATPTVALTEAAESTAADYATLMKRWDEVLSKDIPILNRRLRIAKQPLIHADATPQAEQPHGDEE